MTSRCLSLQAVETDRRVAVVHRHNINGFVLNYRVELYARYATITEQLYIINDDNLAITAVPPHVLRVSVTS